MRELSSHGGLSKNNPKTGARAPKNVFSRMTTETPHPATAIFTSALAGDKDATAKLLGWSMNMKNYAN